MLLDIVFQWDRITACPIELLLAFVERCRYYYCRKMFSSYIDFNFLTFFCKLGRQECQPDVLFQKRRGAPGRHLADKLVIYIDIVAIACDAGLRHFEADEASIDTALLHLSESIAADKVP